ncbi:MAG TPA: putative toxin-antitoxin system toxin component, PIN family [Thermoanaerobaculia bacterium]|nr:putative toxin-antitoxin system toxin component, PIN family [Thermoanaerobaculia bacterium]
MRAVIDTSIVVRAVLRPLGTVGPVLRRLRAADYVLLYSPGLLAEILDVLRRDRFRTKYGIQEDDVENLLMLMVLRGEEVLPSTRIADCRDPKDNQILEIALDGKADVIVTGDDDLLVLHPFRRIPIVGPAEFLARLDIPP